ncbi:GumC family protein [Stieleria varia]|uniref:Chain length determinant protein n=1 Tax=Stieleria varia TaxID=2528005 RepID=A0A5C6A423_9BACT|nr:GumC family protein [Stieleria varia]TWT93891.1 Chain length determinant protein [Stieleria varia]
MPNPSPLDAFATLNVFDIVRATWERRWAAVRVFIALSVLVFFAVLLLPNRYVSKAQLLVRLGPDSVAIDPTAGLSSTVSLQESRIPQVNSIVELLRSKEMVERVVKDVGPDRILEPAGAIAKTKAWLSQWIPKSAPKPQAGYTATQMSDMMQVAEACVAVENDLDIHPAKNAYTITVEWVGYSPFLAHDIVDAFVRQYPAYHKSAHGPAGTVEFFESEAKQAYEVATRLQEKVRKLKSDNGIIELDSAKSALRGELSSVQSEMNNVESELSSVDAELDKLASEIGSMPATVEAEKITGLYKRSGDLVRQRLYELEVQAQELASKYKPDHPKRVAVDSQLAAAKETATSEIGQEPQLREVLNPTLQSLDLAFRTAIARQAGLQAKRDALTRQFERLQKELTQLNQIGVELVQLTWDASVAESTYLETAGRLANARQLESLAALKLSDVSVAQPATLELKKVGPKRMIYLIAGLGFAAMVSLCQAAVRGLWHQDFNPFASNDLPSPTAGHLHSPTDATAPEPAGHLTSSQTTNSNSPVLTSSIRRQRPISSDTSEFFTRQKSLTGDPPTVDFSAGELADKGAVAEPKSDLEPTSKRPR